MLILLLSLVLLLSGCADQAPSEFSRFTPKESQRLIIYTSHKQEVYEPIVREFEQRTGIWVEIVTGGTTELLEKIASGETQCDLLFGGGIDSLSAYGNLFTVYKSPELKNIVPSMQGNGVWTPFSALPIVLIYNPKLVRFNPPEGWSSLLDPAWKGKIAFADPAVSGSSYTALVTMVQALGGEPSVRITDLHRNLDGRVLSSSSEVIDAVAQGEYFIGVTLEVTAVKGIEEGHDIAMVYPVEGTSIVPDGAAIVKNCRHEENAKRFLDFILSEAAQRRLPDSFSRRPVRAELYTPSASGLKSLEYDIAWAGSHHAEILQLWAELSGEEAR
jgi:iron(III) transport system substrate-binding protein